MLCREWKSKMELPTADTEIRVMAGARRVSRLRSHQPLPEVEAVLVALQLPDSPRRLIADAQLLHLEHSPVHSDPDHPGPLSCLALQRDNLPVVQPVLVVSALQIAFEAQPAECLVQGFQAREDPGQKPLEAEGLQARRQQRVERGRRLGIGRVDADAQHDLVVAVAEAAVGQDAADLDRG